MMHILVPLLCHLMPIVKVGYGTELTETKPPLGRKAVFATDE